MSFAPGLRPSGVTPHRAGRGRPGVQGGPTPAARLSPPGDLGGGAPGGVQAAAPLAGGHVHLPEKDRLSRCPVFPERHPSPGPRGSSPGAGVPGSRREAAGGAGRAPGTLTLPVLSARRLGEGGAVDNQVATCLALPRGFHLFIPVSLLPTVVTPFSEILGW